MRITITVLLFLSISIISCKKDENVSPTTNNSSNINKEGYIELYFDSRVGDLQVVLDSPFYTNTFNQNYTISKLDYYISNLVFVKSDGSTYTYPQENSYFLLKESDRSSQRIKIKIPEGNYTGLKFIVGVDSLRSTKPLSERQGVLDPSIAGDMYWGLNDGYVFLNMEGSYKDNSSNTQDYMFQIGGFGGSSVYNNIKEISVMFGSDTALVREEYGSNAPNVHFYTDFSQVVDGTTKVDFNLHQHIMLSAYSLNIANNYSSMFKVDHVHNYEP